MPASYPLSLAPQEGHASHSACTFLWPGHLLVLEWGTTERTRFPLGLDCLPAGGTPGLVLKRDPAESACLSPHLDCLATTGTSKLVWSRWDLGRGRTVWPDIPTKADDLGVLAYVANIHLHIYDTAR